MSFILRSWISSASAFDISSEVFVHSHILYSASGLKVKRPSLLKCSGNSYSSVENVIIFFSFNSFRIFSLSMWFHHNDVCRNIYLMFFSILMIGGVCEDTVYF